MSNPAGRRTRKRTTTELKAIVQFYTSPDEPWKEVTVITTVSRSGAGMTLSRACQPGSLVSLLLPMPRDLRLYDIEDELYQIIGLVQYCHAATADRFAYNIGVGFIGKDMPASYLADPMQSYRISGASEDGLWQIVEAKTAFKARAATRFNIAIPVTLSLTDKQKRTVKKEETATRNISSLGASVVCSLPAAIGDRVKFACEVLDFYAIAFVRNRKGDKNGNPILHLEFVDTHFPIQKITPR